MSIWAAISSRSSGAGSLTGLVLCQTQQNGFPGCSGSPHSLFKLKLVDTSRPGRNAGDVAEHTGSPTGILLGSSSRNILVHKRRSPLPDLKRSPANWRQGHRPNRKITCKIAAKIQIPDARVFFREKIVDPASHQERSLLPPERTYVYATQHVPLLLRFTSLRKPLFSQNVHQAGAASG